MALVIGRAGLCGRNRERAWGLRMASSFTGAGRLRTPCLAAVGIHGSEGVGLGWVTGRGPAFGLARVSRRGLALNALSLSYAIND